MRASKRDQILEQAVEMIGSQGVEAVSFESLAEASGLSKSGLLYHFPTRHDLLLTIHAHLADAWEAELIEAAGGPAVEVSQAARLRAVVITMGRTAPRAQLLMALESSSHPDFASPWSRIEQDWLPSPKEAANTELSRAAYLAQLIADGLWLHDHLHQRSLPDEVRASLIESVLSQIPDE